MFCCGCPYEKNIHKYSFTPSQITLKYGSKNRPWVIGLNYPFSISMKVLGFAPAVVEKNAVLSRDIKDLHRHGSSFTWLIRIRRARLFGETGNLTCSRHLFTSVPIVKNNCLSVSFTSAKHVYSNHLLKEPCAP